MNIKKLGGDWQERHDVTTEFNHLSDTDSTKLLALKAVYTAKVHKDATLSGIDGVTRRMHAEKLADAWDDVAKQVRAASVAWREAALARTPRSLK